MKPETGEVFSRTSPVSANGCGRGETGKRAGLGPQWGACDKENTPCEFKSRRPHHNPVTIFTGRNSIVKYAEESFVANPHQLTRLVGFL